MTGQELKKRVFDKYDHMLCNHCKFRYCADFDWCALLNMAESLTDRQWDNIAKKENEAYDGILDVPYEIMKRRVKKTCKKKNQLH